MATVTRGLGTPHVLTGGLGPASQSSGGPPGGSSGGLVTRGLAGGGLATRGLGAGSPVTPPGTAADHPGYFTDYFPGYSTQYFPGSGPAPGTPVTVNPAPVPAPPGYFTGLFPGFFTHYWPGAGGVPAMAGPVTTPPLAGTFLAAIRRALLADATLAGMVRGGWWHRIAPRGTPEPVGIYAIRTDQRINSSYKSFIEDGAVTLTAYAARDATARDAANRAVDVLTDRSLAWGLYHGRSMYLSLNTPLSSDRPVLGYGGSKTYAAVRVLDFVYQGVEA